MGINGFYYSVLDEFDELGGSNFVFIVEDKVDTWIDGNNFFYFPGVCGMVIYKYNGICKSLILFIECFYGYLFDWVAVFF